LLQVELAETGSQHSFVGELGLVFGDHRRAEASAECIFDYLIVFRGAKQQAKVLDADLIAPDLTVHDSTLEFLFRILSKFISVFV
jgi:hypothetical protein